MADYCLVEALQHFWHGKNEQMAADEKANTEDFNMDVRLGQRCLRRAGQRVIFGSCLVAWRTFVLGAWISVTCC